ncbi:MAG: glutathione ABC transporter ATP-binding protein GsiA [Rhodobacterales bacterium 65-51]|uniref:ABC transporter ATP-binding protein n=1 Tax=uncultured Gemmobacter sp. TaxID=1095917 RepID=UPI000962BA9B|nr:ABC transporter ATP-binding protein [uncultured Gemmobacter sp.]OJY34828.1 MAG: glutathione ABC transporter ATP-binding protein GsiA [Rhodobacterales bacterium 65-51]
MTAAPHLLDVRDLAVSFGHGANWVNVVRDIAFTIDKGETLAIVGESGSGKSVSSMAIMQLLPRATARVQGSIRLAGQELLGLSEPQMEKIRGNRISMIFQEPMTSLNPVLTIGDQVAEAVLSHRNVSRAEARRQAIAMMDRVHIPSAAARYDDYPHRFSGGMRQRVMIAAALACQPDLLIADEPTTALDVTIQAQVLELIKELQAENGMGVLFITHDMGVVAEVADRTLVMFRGDTVETGPTERIFGAPQQAYTRALLSAVPQIGSMAGDHDPLPYPVYDMATASLVPPPPRPSTLREAAAPLLEVRGLTKRFDVPAPPLRRLQKRVHAVENVSFELRHGETLSIVGESGCGKSTLGRLITQLHRPDAGSVRIEGKPVAANDPRALARNVQMVFQDPYASLNPRLRVGEAITEPLLIQGVGNPDEHAALAGQLLQTVGLLPEMASRFPHEFSGGQRQRICVARALALKPKVIVADEAVSALDVTMKVQVVNLMMKLQEEMGLGFIFISHDMAVVERISHRVAVMYMGEIVEIGPRHAVFGNPAHPYTRSLLAAVPLPDPARRHQRRSLPGRELSSPVRPVGFTPPARVYHQPAPGHFVLEPGAEWA